PLSQKGEGRSEIRRRNSWAGLNTLIREVCHYRLDDSALIWFAATHYWDANALCRSRDKSCKVKLLWKADPQREITGSYAASYSVYNSDGSGRGFPCSLQLK